MYFVATDLVKQSWGGGPMALNRPHRVREDEGTLSVYLEQ